ncbi:PaaX family transcriptional regulator C-terminal domain-containing protein [Ideonella sp. DXS22W]|uniref:PaaX family transcriptional regulator C-terminal domain-containing protein n=1 Tax=Pseudaquabacterium inlustre TaxID=2984192 RepID=A0ABU9CLQ6_9BURK
MSPSPRSLILNLLVGTESRGGEPLSVRELLAACAVFGLEGNAVRVALARGVAAGLLMATRRGVYALGPQARPIADEVHSWRATATRLAEWSGDWLAVHVGATGRSDRVALRARDRAFGFLGLAEFERGLHLRPDNLTGGIAALRQRLGALLPAGTEAGTAFVLRGLTAADQQRAESLWDSEALDARYRDATAQMAAWMDRAEGLPLDQAARESFGLGNDAIRHVVFDPLLPAPLVDGAARMRFFDTVARFDDLGQAIWQRLLASVPRPGQALPPTPAIPATPAIPTTDPATRVPPDPAAAHP